MQLTSTDRVFGAHRSHGHYLALGGSVYGLFAEVLGRQTGVSRGMGGSMHLIDRSIGLYGTVPIVGATIPIATGAALASKLQGDRSVAVSFFGDGATEEGGFHESMNMAAIMKLPVLFVCENNLFSSHLHIALRQPTSSTSRFAIAHGIQHRLLDGNDVVAVAQATRELLADMRDGAGPAFLELVTYRWRGHVGWRDDEDVGVSRGADLPAWKSRDPIARLVEGMRTAGLLTSDALAAEHAAVETIVSAAWQQAQADPFPDENATLARVFATDSGRQEGRAHTND